MEMTQDAILWDATKKQALEKINRSKVYDFGKPYIIFDIDGTLANIKHRLHYVQVDTQDWDSFNDAMGNDAPNEHIIAINKAMCKPRSENSYPAIIVTGRPETHREQTERWLQRHGINYVYLFMRPAGDFRSDVDIKRDIIKNNIGDTKVLFVIDDRSKVVDLWREMGYKCLQSQKGDY